MTRISYTLQVFEEIERTFYYYYQCFAKDKFDRFLGEQKFATSSADFHFGDLDICEFYVKRRKNNKNDDEQVTNNVKTLWVNSRAIGLFVGMHTLFCANNEP
ncbi:MAG: hypothetical protein AAF429_02475 [Pseudomonadota bacterium]